MKCFKKLLSIFVTCILAIAITGCGTKNPTEVVMEKLDSLKADDSSEFSQVFNGTLSSDDKNKDSKDSFSESTKKMEESIKSITYIINSETIDGDKAKVNVTVNGPDMAEALNQFIDKAFSETFSQAFSGQTLSEEESNAKYDKMFVEILNGMKNTDRTMDIELVKENGEWTIKDENDLVKLILNINPDAVEQIVK